MEVFHLLCIDKCHENELKFDTLLRGLVPRLVILNTFQSMSDCLEMCLRIIDSGVSIGTSAWGVCVYSISGGQTGSISKSGCFSDILCIAVCTGVNC